MLGKMLARNSFKIAIYAINPWNSMICKQAVISRTFAGRVKSGSGRSKKPSPPISIDDAWKEVKDPESGQIYFWNTVTNQTTALGEPKPTSSVPGPSNSSVPAPAPPQQSGGMMSGLGGVVAEGFAFGVGSSLARHAVGSLFGGSSSSSSSNSLEDNSSDSDGDSWDI